MVDAPTSCVLNLKGMILENKGRKQKNLRKRRSNNYIQPKKQNGIEKRVKTLKRLIPNNGKSQGLDGLFRDTASYIISLQMRVRVMQILVDVLENSQDNIE
ncbi:unnamed protein product [Amaranthus hypochondriacus]